MDKESDNKLNSLLEDALDDLLNEDEAAAEKPKPKPQQSVKPKKDKKKSKPKEKPDFDEEEMNRFFTNMTEQLKAELPTIDPNEAQAKINESVPQIFEMMQNLLSKELLYPALKDLSPKFEEWLKKNGPTLGKEEKERYEKQICMINDIIGVFDDESLSNQERFERNLDLMEQMQSLGSPPEELTVPEGMSKCSIM